MAKKRASTSRKLPALKKDPMCEECDEELERYEESPDTGMGGWRCPLCAWSWDDPKIAPRTR
jgi:ribosomal protein L37AE/L43A